MLLRQVVDGLVLDEAGKRHLGGGHPREEELHAARVDHRPGEQVRARRFALLDDADRHVPEPLGELGPLLQELARPDRGGEARRPCADDEDPDVDPLVGRVRRLRDHLGRIERRREVGRFHVTSPSSPVRAP